MAVLKRVWEKIKGWKTAFFAFLLGIAGILQEADLASIVPKEKVGIVLLGIAVVVFVLRTITTTPIGK